MVTRFTLVANKFLQKLKKMDRKIQNFDLLAKQVLDKKVRGYFVLRNGEQISSDYLRLSTFDVVKYPYFIKCHAYTKDGTFWENHEESKFDIVEFIQEEEEKKEKDMDTLETRNVTLTLEKAREWYWKGGELREVALQAYNEKELTWKFGAQSWYEYCMKYNINADEHASINSYQELSLLRLFRLRKDWIGDWEPCWEDGDTPKYCIRFHLGEVEVTDFYTNVRSLSFPTPEMANSFCKTFHTMLKDAQYLI